MVVLYFISTYPKTGAAYKFNCLHYSHQIDNVLTMMQFGTSRFRHELLAPFIVSPTSYVIREYEECDPVMVTSKQKHYTYSALSSLIDIEDFIRRHVRLRISILRVMLHIANI